MNIIKQVREHQPLIYNLTNQVVTNFSANGLLAFGASPAMTQAPEEARDMTTIANGVLINIGTEPSVEAMIIAGQTANEHNIPVVLDPVAVAASTFRKQVVETLLDKISFTAIKGNAGEMAHLVGIPWDTKGVESIDHDLSQLEKIARKVAREYDTLAIVTGEVDVLCHNEDIIKNTTGHEYLTKITGGGCLLGSIVTACLTTDAKRIDAAYEAVRFYGLAAEKAANNGAVYGPGTFLPHFIDELGR